MMINSLAFRVEVSAFSNDLNYTTFAEIMAADMSDIDSSPNNYDQGLNEDVKTTYLRVRSRRQRQT